MAEKNNANIGFEKQIWDAACVLWGHIPAAEYRKVIIGLIFLRYISSAFERKYNELVAEGSSVWAIIENASRIIRVAEYADASTHDDDTCNIDPIKHFKAPADLEYEYMGEKTVLYSDIDFNGHLNNTNYPDILLSFIPEMKYERGAVQNAMYADSMLINFVSEAPLGCNVKVYMSRQDEYIYMRTVRDDGKVNAEARITLKSV